MAYADLRAFIQRLEETGELHRIQVEADPELEVAGITARVSKEPGGGKALWFQNVNGSAFPLVTNLFGSNGRMCAALGIAELTDLTGRMETALSGRPAGVPHDVPIRFSGCSPITVEDPPCQKVVEETPDLTSYPFIKCWPHDGQPWSGRAITLPMVFTVDPETGERNCGMYRVGILDKKRASIHWRKGSGGERHHGKYVRRGERTPVALVVGAEPMVMYAASLPFHLDEMEFAAFLGGAPVEMSRCKSCDLMVPASAELVIEGYIEPGETVDAGAFGNHTGFYMPVGQAPLLHVTCITRRSDPIIPATVIGPPPMEDCWMAKAAERLLLPLVRRAVPEIIDINLPMEGIFHNCLVVSIDKKRPGQGRDVIKALWESREMGNARLIVVVDGDADVRDLSYVGWRLLNNVDWRMDLVVAGGEDCSRLGIDATRKLPHEAANHPWREEIRMDGAISSLVEMRWREYGL